MADKTLILSRLPVESQDETGLELTFGGRDLGYLTLHADDLSEFVQGLKEGFPAVVFAAPDRKPQDVASFVQGMIDKDD